MSEDEAEALGEDIRDGYLEPNDDSDRGAHDYLNWYFSCLDGGR